MDDSRQALTNGGSNGLPTHSGDVDPKYQHLGTTPRAAWNRFNGHGRKRVGVFQSIKAVLFSSCISFPVVLRCSWNSLLLHRPERVIGLHSRRLGFPLPTLG